jgi:hypothetical protein
MDTISARMRAAPSQRGALLIDTLPGVRLQLVESKTAPKGAILVVRGEFGLVDRATANNRLYRRSLWERQINRLAKEMAGGGVLGHLEHPKDGTTSLREACHVVTKLEIDGDKVYGEALIADNPDGRRLKSLYEIGARIGVSSRGFGTTRKDEQGRDVVQDDYELMTFDFVAEPAARTYPRAVTERKEMRMNHFRVYLTRSLALLERLDAAIQAEARVTREARAQERRLERMYESIGGGRADRGDLADMPDPVDFYRSVDFAAALESGIPSDTRRRR